MKKVQCVRCVKQKLEGHKNKDKYKLRECIEFFPRTENNSTLERRFNEL